ncbi:MAG: formate dehydrogenase [Gammaproteobacteria bacterium]|nr:formate dehydrogenase [Gammaproteobacteria bacterium]MDE0226934.1 formate dehydrogenase [Gammaproteobacteria bacterium]
MSVAKVPRETLAVALGADELALELAQAGHEVMRTGSYGLCWAEPMIDIDGIAYGPVTDLADLEAARLGPVDALPDLLQQERRVFDRCGRTDPFDYDPEWLRSQLEREPVEIIGEIEASGLRGRGGAGFPAHIKWRTVHDTPADEKYVIVNADEGDSGTFADRLIMEGDPFRLIEGMLLAGRAVGAGKGIVYLRSEYPLAAEVFARAIDSARDMGLLEGFDIELFVGAGAYICGEETSLLESLEGKRGEIRAKPPVPAVAGLFGKPTLVHNVITLCAVPDILERGGADYAALGVGASTGTMTFQLAGNVKKGALIELPFGISLRALIEDWGGGTRSGRPVGAVQVGGPLGAYLKDAELDTPMTYEALAAIGAGVGHGGIVVFDETVDLVLQAHYAFAFCAHESCGKCTPCRIGAVRGKETVEAFMASAQGDDELAIIRDLCDVMEQASLCQMGGMTPIPVRSALGLK